MSPLALGEIAGRPRDSLPLHHLQAKYVAFALRKLYDLGKAVPATYCKVSGGE